MDDLIAFVTARLDEDERELVKDPPVGLGYANLAGRMHREVEAKRRILAACAETLQGEESHDYITEGGSGEEYDLARFALRQLAAVWNDHPGYRAEWKP